jgi:purine-cytosine permease-like protein
MTNHNKAIVALIMAILVVLEQIFGIPTRGVPQEWVTAVLAAITPIVVWLIPNKKSSG